MNKLDFVKKKQSGVKISMITCYDYSFAKIVDSTDLDCILIGDSLAMVMHGYDSTVHATIELMSLHTEAVRRGTNKFLVSDMPFMSNRKGVEFASTCAETLMRAGANSVKIEGAEGNLDIIRHLVGSGIPVMGHLGLTPQSVNELGGFRVQAKTDLAKEKLLKDSLALEKAGCFALVLECVPSDIAKTVSESLSIPTIGIGAGSDCDGQVLVLQDILGLNTDFKPKFVRNYESYAASTKLSFNLFHKDIQTGGFPNSEESFL
ncbi:MAG: 3-methyl-2-oxobutanoate hydroxymethyltransferase [Bdellovibrionales bacterium]